jgi:pyridoxine kinase
METLKLAIRTLHEKFRIPHIIITSVAFSQPGATPSLCVVGSTFTSTAAPRMFSVQIPAIDCFFSGTGDMFAALMLVRFRQAVNNVPGLMEGNAWVSGDNVQAIDLPLAKAAELVLASMHEVLTQTKIRRDEELEKYTNQTKGVSNIVEDEKRLRLVKSKAAEVRLVRNLGLLKHPEVKFRAEVA